MVNASVATKWVLNDEDFASEAGDLLVWNQFARVRFTAPAHIQYDVGNALRVAVRPGRISLEDAKLGYDRFLTIRIQLVSSEELLRDAFDISTQYDCAFYDGLYLALSAGTGFPLVHADGRLRNTLDGRFPNERWIADFLGT